MIKGNKNYLNNYFKGDKYIQYFASSRSYPSPLTLVCGIWDMELYGGGVGVNVGGLGGHILSSWLSAVYNRDGGRGYWYVSPRKIMCTGIAVLMKGQIQYVIDRDWCEIKSLYKLWLSFLGDVESIFRFEYFSVFSIRLKINHTSFLKTKLESEELVVWDKLGGSPSCFRGNLAKAANDQGWLDWGKRVTEIDRGDTSFTQ